MSTCTPFTTGDSKAVLVKAFMLTEDGRSATPRPARLYLAKDRVEFFGMTLHYPWAPCVSRDGKTLVIVVDSNKPQKPIDLVY